MRIQLWFAVAALSLIAGGCGQSIEVAITRPAPGADVYGTDTVVVDCHPARSVDYVELSIDSVVVGRDSYPIFAFEWNVAGLLEGSTHRLQARAVAGASEYFSVEETVRIGYRSRLATNGTAPAIDVYLPTGTRTETVNPGGAAESRWPRLTPGCSSVVFVVERKIEVVGTDGRNRRVLAEQPNGIYSCDAAPTGSFVAFEGYPAATAHLFIVDAATGSVTQLTHDGDVYTIDSSPFAATGNSGPVFSPDGGTIAYFRASKCLAAGDPHEGEERRDAFLIDRTGAVVANLTAAADDGSFTGFTWTLDGRWVIFRNVGGAAPVLAASRSGRVIALGLGAEPLAVAASPTDSTLAFIDADHGLQFCGLAWNTDTIYVRSGPVRRAEGLGRDLDWVRFP